MIPSHTGILQNELIDSEVQEAANLNDSSHRSILVLRSEAKAAALQSWRDDACIQRLPAHSHPQRLPRGMPPPQAIEPYWGRSWLDSPELRRVTHTGKFLLTYFEGSSLAARAIRFLTDHAPMYRSIPRALPPRHAIPLRLLGGWTTHSTPRHGGMQLV